MNRIVSLPIAKSPRKEQSPATAKGTASSSKCKPTVTLKSFFTPLVCSWCAEAEPEHGSIFCSPACEAKGVRIQDADYGKAFTSHLLSAVNEAGPYREEVHNVTLEVFARADLAKSGSKIPSRHCQWNDGWDIRTVVTFEGKEMSFKALKGKLDTQAYEQAESTIAELRDCIKAVAIAAVPSAKIAVIQSALRDPFEDAPEACVRKTETSNEETKDGGVKVKKEIDTTRESSAVQVSGAQSQNGSQSDSGHTLGELVDLT